MEWALAHQNWTVEQWNMILWTDKTWVTGGQHSNIWVTRKVNFEELN